ncbi:helix-turn-helix domain-containing protein [Aureibaculum algae]|uniref:Helix-turn-helix domain-containing protein n=1 Tax=Aureibaculum algae TaxID=2584122 RepID=A0A5B7TRM3_9FLAO|nr:helix-turn-helix domain-containing protein [Aureibaculum algae]QCX37212.1 helix-turn-helix domain-containing protein [Aureibaculum algae]
MSNVILYGFTNKDLERTIEVVVNRLRKTELITSNNNNPEEDRLTQREAAELLGITVQCLIQWKKKKLVPYYQIGRSIFYSKKELLQQARNNPALVKTRRK